MPIIGDTQIQPVNFLEQYMRGQEFARGRRVNEQADQLNALKLQAAEREQSNAMALQQALARGRHHISAWKEVERGCQDFAT